MWRSKILSNTLNNIGILGTGSSLPTKILTNFDLEKMIETSDEWILKRTGISQRRILDKEIPSYELGVKAANNAIENAGINALDIGLIIVATETPDFLTPSMACIIQSKIGAKNAAAFDVNAACSGFIYSLNIASQFIKNNAYNYILVIGCEALSKVLDWEDRNTCVLFGDGAGAVVLGPVPKDRGILSTYIGSDGDLGKNITIPCCSITPEEKERRVHENKRVVWMDGSEVFKFAVKIMASATFTVLDKAGLTIDDVDLIIPHQANMRIIDSAIKRLNVSQDKMFININKYANMSSATIPVALDEAIRTKRVKSDDIIVLVGFGGGLTWGSAVIKL